MFANEHHATNYGESSRETFCKHFIHHFWIAILIEGSGKAINNANYRFYVIDEMPLILRGYDILNGKRILKYLFKSLETDRYIPRKRKCKWILLRLIVKYCDCRCLFFVMQETFAKDMWFYVKIMTTLW